jgi:hypothetical protein
LQSYDELGHEAVEFSRPLRDSELAGLRLAPPAAVAGSAFAPKMPAPHVAFVVDATLEPAQLQARMPPHD